MNVCSPILNDRVNSLYYSFKYSFRVRFSREEDKAVIHHAKSLHVFIQISRPSVQNHWTLKNLLNFDSFGILIGILIFNLRHNFFIKILNFFFFLISNDPCSKFHLLFYSCSRIALCGMIFHNESWNGESRAFILFLRSRTKKFRIRHW